MIEAYLVKILQVVWSEVKELGVVQLFGRILHILADNQLVCLQDWALPSIKHSNIFPNTTWEMIEVYLVKVLQVVWSEM